MKLGISQFLEIQKNTVTIKWQIWANSKKNTIKGQGWTQPEMVYKMKKKCTIKGQGWTPPKSFLEPPYFGGAP